MCQIISFIDLNSATDEIPQGSKQLSSYLHAFISRCLSWILLFSRSVSHCEDFLVYIYVVFIVYNNTFRPTQANIFKYIVFMSWSPNSSYQSHLLLVVSIFPFKSKNQRFSLWVQLYKTIPLTAIHNYGGLPPSGFFDGIRRIYTACPLVCNSCFLKQ